MGSEAGNTIVLRNLAQDLLNQEENAAFKDALQTYRKTNSLTSLVTHLTKAITNTEKLMLLVELSSVLPAHLRRDFHKLCCLHFPKYESFLTYFTPNSFGERSHVISKDPSGQFQVVSSSSFDKNFYLPVNSVTSDQRSLPGESGIDVNSDIDDISRHGDGSQSMTGSAWKIASRPTGRSSSVSSQASRSAPVSETPQGSVRSQNELQRQWRQSQTSLPTGSGHSSSVRNRARSLRILSGSLPTVLMQKVESEPRADSKARILLRRRDDGSLGIGIKGGKEYSSPIVVYVVEPGSQGEAQGLRVGDRILDVNGTDFSNITHAEAVMMMRNAWNIIMIVQRSNSNSDSVDRGSANRARQACDELEVLLYPSKKGKLGCGVYRDDKGHLIVKSVEKNSAASKSGLRLGDRFLEIDGIKVGSLTDKQIAALTHVKRTRLKIQRPSNKKAVGDDSNLDFDDMFTSLALDLSPLGLGDNEDIPTFTSSTPRQVGRSHSEERKPNLGQQKQSQRGRSSSQIVQGTNSDNVDNGPIQKVEVEVHHAIDSPSTETNISATERPKEQSPPVPLTSPPQRLVQQTHVNHSGTRHSENPTNSSSNQQRMYRPRVITSTAVLGASTSQHRQSSSHHGKSLGRYMQNQNQSALPSRLAMMYSPAHTTSSSDAERDRSRPKKRSGVNSVSTSSKMKQLRNRSHSPHGNNGHSTQQRDREFLRAIQNSVERRQKAHRLSLYQLPDQDNEAWNIV